MKKLKKSNNVLMVILSSLLSNIPKRMKSKTSLTSTMFSFKIIPTPLTYKTTLETEKTLSPLPLSIKKWSTKSYLLRKSTNRLPLYSKMTPRNRNSLKHTNPTLQAKLKRCPICKRLSLNYTQKTKESATINTA